ncbi:MAG TPA: hypothetical protein VG265_02170 [Gaiellaceae bacterium]|nr:hypothetical protein [Gaiellaceae bacterium]
MRRLERRWPRLRAAVVIGLAGFAVLGWQGVSTIGHNGGVDAGEHLQYAIYLDAHGRLPSKADNYEYASPPLFAATAVALERFVRAVPSVGLDLGGNGPTRGLWLLIVCAGAAAMTASRLAVRRAGLAMLATAVLWGVDEALSLGKSEPWTAGQLVALASGLGLILLSGLIAREIWPASRRRPIAVGALVAAYPVLFRMSILFHPEVPFALLCAAAMLAVLRAARRGWPNRLGWWLGAACGGAALTRQPALLVTACLGGAALVAGRREAVGFLGRAALVIVLLAGPWWIYATYRFHNPIQSNLDLTPDRMLSSEPPSFYLGVPLRALVVHPYRPDFTNELLPKLHAEIWSDWFGSLHDWSEPTANEKAAASSESLLGLAGDALALCGLFLIAIPAGRRTIRRARARLPADRTSDFGLALLALVAVLAFVAFVVTLVRFPQRDGDPIKSSYLLFTAPCWATFTVAAWAAARRRARLLGRVLAGVAVLFVAAYASDLGAALSQPGPIGNLDTLPNDVDLVTSFQQTSPTPGVGGEIDFLVEVAETGGQTADDVTLTVDIPQAMKMIGLPYYDTGTCNKVMPIRCSFGSISGGDNRSIRIALDVDQPGPQTLTASGTVAERSARPRDATASAIVDAGGS